MVGQSNHAGTTPMELRHDPGYVAARIATFVRELADDLGPPQVGTVGSLSLHPNLVNVVAARAVVTVDLRNTDDSVLAEAEHRLAQLLDEVARAEGVTITTRSLARFEPVTFDERVVRIIHDLAGAAGLMVRRMPSGAGHDAQMFARVCPTAMIFVPSENGISHNPAEHTDVDDLEAGANLLLHTLLQLAGDELGWPSSEPEVSS
ncbi:MAG: M20/M25/M40 family metallo-hydrolase [Acidimicrobiales bacterium]